MLLAGFSGLPATPRPAIAESTQGTIRQIGEDDSLKGHAGSTARVPAAHGRRHLLILPAGAQLPGMKPNCRDTLLAHVPV